MNISIKKLPKSQVEILIELSSEETQPYIDKAAKKLGQTVKIDGFRKGHVPYDVLKRHVGEMAIYEAALEDLVNATYFQAVSKEKLDVIGQPQIEIIKMAPGNALEYKATTAILPVLTIGDLAAIKIQKRKIEVSKEDVEKSLFQLQRMQSKEAVVNRSLGTDDKAVVDMEMFLNKVPVEGGQTSNHAIYLSDEHYIPGIKEKIVGMKKDEVREFILPFPKEHFQKHLAGKDIEFKVKLKEVFEVTPPDLDEAFVQGLGQKNLEDLRALMKENIQKERDERERDRFENEMLEKLIECSTFGDIPEILITAEIEKMMQELKRGVSAKGMEFSEYLQLLKKTEAELKLDFSVNAAKRVKMALASRRFALDQKIDVSEEEVTKEIEDAKALYADDENMGKQISSPESRAYVYNSLRNKKAIEKMIAMMMNEDTTKD